MIVQYNFLRIKIKGLTMKETLKQAGYNYMRYLGNGEHLLEYVKGEKPYQFEIWTKNKNHASYGLIYKNTHLEFCRSARV